MPQKIFKNMHFLDFSDFRRGVYPAHGRHSGSSAMPLAEVIHEIRLKNKKWNFSEKLYLFDEKYFSKDWWKIENFKKVNFFRKSAIFRNFSKKLTFWNFRFFRNFSENVTFWNFRFFKIVRKIFFIEKNTVFRKKGFFIVSHV